MYRKRNKSVEIAGTTIAPGERQEISLKLPNLYTHSETTMSAIVVNGRFAGPRLFASAAIHGDELNGIEIIRRLLQHKSLKRLRGTLIAIPIVNIFGCLTGSRYLPDGRDLNRLFPGNVKGSMASRIAHQFMEQVVRGCNFGIDLHTGSRHRENLPHVRTSPEVEQTHIMARAFGAPLMMDADLRDGSLRHAALAESIPVLLYEAGEALRFNELCIRAGVSGVISVMRGVGMLAASKRKRQFEPLVAKESSWIRAPRSGVVRLHRGLGDIIAKDEPLGEISDPAGENSVTIEAKRAGMIISVSRLPLVHEGEALIHVAHLGQSAPAEEVIAAFGDTHDPELTPDVDEPVIID